VLVKYIIIVTYRPNSCRLSSVVDIIFMLVLICCLLRLDFGYQVFVVLAKPSPEESQEEEMEMFKKLYIEWKGDDQSKDPQYKAIPRFYFKVFMMVSYMFLAILFVRVLYRVLHVSSERNIVEKVYSVC